jgi:hypothetical protein
MLRHRKTIAQRKDYVVAFRAEHAISKISQSKFCANNGFKN